MAESTGVQVHASGGPASMPLPHVHPSIAPTPDRPSGNLAHLTNCAEGFGNRFGEVGFPDAAGSGEKGVGERLVRGEAPLDKALRAGDDFPLPDEPVETG